MLTSIRFACVCLVLAFLIAAPVLAQEATPEPTPTPLIIDTDMVSDDWMAILYLTQDPNFDIQAITVTGAGFAECDAGVAAALGLLDLVDYGDVPVSCWKDEPLRGGAVRVPADWRLTMAGVEAAGLAVDGQPAEENAVELFTSTVEASDTPITVLALGGFTNIAAAFEAKPELVDQIARIYVMGGAVDVPGNVDGADAANTTAEWNIYVDPTAARIVFESGVPITLVGLDATNEVPVTVDFLERLEAEKTTPVAEFIYAVLNNSRDSIESGWYYFWDPLAAGVLSDPALVTLTDRDVAVIDQAGPDFGRTKPVEAGEGALIQVASGTDAEAFEQQFMEHVNR